MLIIIFIVIINVSFKIIECYVIIIIIIIIIIVVVVVVIIINTIITFIELNY